MRCKTCLRVFRGGGSNLTLHNWSKQQCAKCHYFGVGKVGRKNRLYRKEKHRGALPNHPEKKEYHKRIVTNRNFDLFCKLQKIIQGVDSDYRVLFNQNKVKNAENLTIDTK